MERPSTPDPVAREPEHSPEPAHPLDLVYYRELITIQRKCAQTGLELHPNDLVRVLSSGAIVLAEH